MTPLKSYKCPRCDLVERDLEQKADAEAPLCKSCKDFGVDIRMQFLWEKPPTLRIGKGDNSASVTPKKFRS